jgi:hypothetical protein
MLGVPNISTGIQTNVEEIVVGTVANLGGAIQKGE